MKNHIYNISIEEMETDKNQKIELAFENHDDLFAIIAKLSEKKGFTTENAALFGTGLKLIADVVRKNKTISPFNEIMPLLADIMKIVKRRE